ncbi:MAG: hypothetical protein V2B18_03720 [Pseudomonadota bacterium]
MKMVVPLPSRQAWIGCGVRAAAKGRPSFNPTYLLYFHFEFKEVVLGSGSRDG